MIDSRGALEGKLYLFGSYNVGCDSYWGTVYTTTTYMTAFDASTYRWNSTDDSGYLINNWSWPNYCHLCWKDAPMMGMDAENPADCIYAVSAWRDRYNVVRGTSTPSVCG
ncbi:MAG: hypothetical protein ACJ797_24555 [Ktedonobacteraceae bacterium]